MCVLRATGRSFEPRAFLAGSKLTPFMVYRLGDPEHRGRTHSTSGFRVDVSRRDGSDLDGQIEDAIAFLETHRVDLERLATADGIEDIRLDFPVDLRIEEGKVCAQFEYFPPALLSKAGELGLGLEVSLYPHEPGQLTTPANQELQRTTGLPRFARSPVRR